MIDLPVLPGSYALHLRLDVSALLPVGRLGAFDFPAGDYLYLGSARGPGGLRARLRHHLRAASKPHWHIDWLRSAAVPVGGWYASTPSGLECTWSQALFLLEGALLPARGFGSADCRSGCRSHLVAFPGGLRLRAVEDTLRGAGENLVSLAFFFVE